MDSNQQTPLADTITGELSHVAEELYKKNFTLDQTNKTLALLRKIDGIILSSVTDLPQIAQQVADTVATDAELEVVMIFLNDKKNHTILQLATSQTEIVTNIQIMYNKLFYPKQIPMTDTINPVVKSVNGSTATFETLHDFLFAHFQEEEIKKIAETTGITSCSVYPLFMRGETIGAMVICSATPEIDFSPYKKDLISRLVEVVGISIDNALLYQRIQEANARLEALDQLKDEFVSLASHELRTPMTAISSYIWMMMNGEVGSINNKQKVYLQNAYTSTKRLIALVNDMLNVSRIESGRMILKQEPMDLEQIAQQTLTEIMPTAQLQGITITIEKPGNPLPKVLADENKIKEVIMNLVGNSLKFTPTGGKITISFAEKDNLVETYVIDNGRGIKAEDVPKLFKKFGMIEGNYFKTTPGQGTGLGLYIAKSIVELHGGSISFHSDGENKGTTFSFTLKKA